MCSAVKAFKAKHLKKIEASEAVGDLSSLGEPSFFKKNETFSMFVRQAKGLEVFLFM